MDLRPSSPSDVELPHPSLKAILLCDRIVEEAGTSKIALVGILDRLTVPEFPFDYVRGLELYVQVTDAAGEYAIRMDLVCLDDEHTVGQGEAVNVIVDRRYSHEVRFDFPRIPFERPGSYEFRVFANSRFVGAAVLLVEYPA